MVWRVRTNVHRRIWGSDGYLESSRVATCESTLQAERERLIADLERERERAERLERELAKARLLSEELEAERSKGFWRRLFGA